MNSGIVRTGRQHTLIPPQADTSIGHWAGLTARLFLFKLVRGYPIGDALVRRHAAYCQPMAFERYEPTMIHRRHAGEIERLPALRVDIE